MEITTEMRNIANILSLSKQGTFNYIHGMHRLALQHEPKVYAIYHILSKGKNMTKSQRYALIEIIQLKQQKKYHKNTRWIALKIDQRCLNSMEEKGLIKQYPHNSSLRENKYVKLNITEEQLNLIKEVLNV